MSRPAGLPAPRPAVDAVVVAALLVVSYLVRRGGLPTDGLWYDDAWVGAGASKAGVGDLLHVSTNHPGFTAMLMGWTRLVSRRSELMAWPDLVAGTVAAPLVYLALRRWKVTREVAVAACAALVVSTAHVQYSTRVKSYVFETLVVLAVAVVLPRLARTTWRAPLAAAWVAGAVLVGTLSAFALPATAVAMAVLVLHPRGDRRVRILALGIQGVVQAAYLRTVQRTYDAGRLTSDWEDVYNGYIELHGNPVEMARQIGSHVSRVGQALFDGRGLVPALVVIVALAGLAAASRSGPGQVAARYLLALPVLAAAGSVVRLVPFGASNEIFFSPGWRASLWLLPSLVAGLGFALDRIVAMVRSWWPRSEVVLRVAAAVGAVVIVVAGWDQHGVQPLSGSRSAHEYVEAELGPDGIAIMFGAGVFPYAVEPGVRVAVDPAPETLNGWVPRLLDRRIWLLSSDPWDGSMARLERQLRGHRRVIVHDGLAGFADNQLPALQAGLRKLGFVPREELLLGGSVSVARWERSR